mmetsp:Transcript_7560/g.30715  ORF Transcript_7560/g.30715 Transcript_7560/m.30715 type:complete len:233 (-) Transcript_7560:136-834(-)|eukprot:PRCOL_00000755-RA
MAAAMDQTKIALTNEELAACSHEWVHKSYQAQTSEESEKIYNEWAKVYDSTMDPDKYQAPIGLVKHLVAKKLLPDTSCKILDVGCGTGLLGKYCKEMAGYSNIDGMDNSQGMLDEAAKKDVYGKLFKGTLGEKLDCESNVYDGAVSSGVFTPGHAPASGLIEVARMVKVGGIVCYTLKLDLYEASDYPAIHKQLVDDGTWEDAGHSEPYAALPGDEGSKDCMLCAFTWRVLK